MSDTVIVPINPVIQNNLDHMEDFGPNVNINASASSITDNTNSSSKEQQKYSMSELSDPTSKDALHLLENTKSVEKVISHLSHPDYGNSDINEVNAPSEITNDVDYDPENDNASVLVLILQCETKSCDTNITHLKWVFSDPYFTVQVCAVDPPSAIPTIKTLTQTQYIENYYMRKVLNYAAEGPYLSNSQGKLEAQFWWANIPVIIIKDSSISNIKPAGTTDQDHPNNPDDKIIGGMKRRIKTSLDKAKQADLFFLCKWNDACNKYTDVDNTNNIDHGSTLKWSVQPTATQAIMYIPSSRDFIHKSLITATVPLGNLLNSNIAKGNLLATVFVPNIIDFDIDLATSNDDFSKLNECASVQGTTGASSGVASFVWFVLIIIAVLLVAWALIQLSPQNTSIAIT